MMGLKLLALSLLAVTVGQNTVHAQWDANVVNGQVIVHLFEWKWTDIATECENFLGPKGYGGVQISPPNEYVVAWNEVHQRPWWERYQPVSYNLISRSGDEADFTDMVQRCNNVGVRIYVDAVINHMSGLWPVGTPGVGGGSFNFEEQSYPGVPYSEYDFNDGNCNTTSGSIENYDDVQQVRNCKLYGLNDLNQGNSNVREMIWGYMNKVIDIGVAGFRVDAAKHMWPSDLNVIFGGLHDLNEQWFPAGSRPFLFQEVIDQEREPITAADYTALGRVTEFKYGLNLGSVFRNGNLKWLQNYGEAWGFIDGESALVFIDNHDNQRGHGGGGDQVLTFRVPRWYKMANAFMLAWPYGFTRVMSSYYWDENIVDGEDQNDWIGPPHDEYYNIVSPTFGPDEACSNGWICEHRWSQIYNMVKFRNVAHDTGMNDWWDNGSNQIAFCRGDKGFIAINNDDYDLTQTLQTRLPAGTYCDVITGNLENGICTGKTVTVNGDGTAYIEIMTTENDGILAIHAESKM